jgi:hypothetical protein
MTWTQVIRNWCSGMHAPSGRAWFDSMIAKHRVLLRRARTDHNRLSESSTPSLGTRGYEIGACLITLDNLSVDVVTVRSAVACGARYRGRTLIR